MAQLRVGGVSVEESTNDLLTVLSACIEHAKGILGELNLSASDSYKLQVRPSRGRPRAS
jgi:hypothetical protein